MPTKAYFIGLGGCGLKTVANLQQRLCPTGQTDEYKFTYVDTDDDTIKKFNEGGRSVVKINDFLNLGQTNPRAEYDVAKGGQTEKQRRFMEWIIPQDGSARFDLPYQPLYDGARARRMIGRTAVHREYENIKSELEKKISTFAAYDPMNPTGNVPSIWVVASSCGGTGSSMTLDILYMIDRIVVEKYHQSPDLKLVLFMPKQFIDNNKSNDDYPLNAFAYLWEMNAFRLDYQSNITDRFYNFSVGTFESSGKPFPLYKYVIPVDPETSKGAIIPLESLYPVVAELIYYSNMGQAAADMRSKNSNDQNVLDGLTTNENSFCTWTQTLVPYGYRLIKKANDELRQYMSVRAKYEVLKYGILGAGIPEDEREVAKVAFAKDYILKAICSIPKLGVMATDSSLEAEVNAVFDAIRVNPNGLDRARIQYNLTSIDEAEAELKSLESKIFNIIKGSIDKGVEKIILEKGLVYAKELLHLVDDFYLERTVLPELKLMKEDILAKKESKRSECGACSANFKEKQAPAAAKLLTEYRDLASQYQIIHIAINLIENKLTAYPLGYLELLRKGDESRTTGLHKVINMIENEASDAYERLTGLAKSFIESEKEALTIYLPQLHKIAQGQNDSFWTKDSLFERLYHESMITYDKVLDAASQIRVPVRNSEGDNNLRFFISPVCSGATSLLKLAQSEVLNVGTNLQKWIISPIDDQIQVGVNRENTLASDWMKLPLYDSLEIEGMLPSGMDRVAFLNNMAELQKMPVLYPQGAGSTVPRMTRFRFACASKEMAKSLGYEERSSEHDFIEDPSMDDRILIIKMPYGLDFWSYKYFDEIKKFYLDRWEDVKAGHYGCHIHKDFSLLNITPAVDKVQQPRNVRYVQTLFSAVFYQKFLDLLMEHNRPLYDRVWGEFSLDFGTPSEQSSGYDFGFDQTPAQQSTEVFEETASKNLIEVDFQNKTFTFKINKVTLTDNHLHVEADSEKTKTVTALSFVKNFVNDFISTQGKDSAMVSGKHCMEILTTSVESLSYLISTDDDVRKAYSQMCQQVAQAVLATPLFQLAVSWRKRNDEMDKPYFPIFNNIIKGIVR
ncbi:MAG: hypothetical protein IKV05_00030 [Bacteroidales bacterium]|nr:hypothetical protein [Bacteroidales bacterium]